MLTLESLLPLLSSLSDDRTTPPPLKALAEAANRSPSHFQRAFARLVKESPKQFTRRLQLELAAVTLMSTGRSIIDVALEVGFESHEGFTRAFSSHFHKSPSQFRRHCKQQNITPTSLHLKLISQVGPCITLFRAPIAKPNPKKRKQRMNYDITIQAVEESTLLYKEARCEHSAVATQLAACLPAVFQHALQNGIEMTGPPITVYTDWGPGMVTMEAGVSVKAGSEGSDEILTRILSAGKAAVTIHQGAYDGLGDAHAALEAFLHKEGLKKNGAAREIYLTDPGEVPNPEDWRTQVIWPVED